MVETLGDPYTSYMDKEAFQMSMAGLEGKYEGIGAYVGVRDEQLVIIAPIPGSPAAAAERGDGEGDPRSSRVRCGRALAGRSLAG